MSIAVAQYEVNERTSARISFIIKNEDGQLVPKMSLRSVELWLFEKSRKTIINGRGVIDGAGQDILTAGVHGVTIGDADGLVTWNIAPADTACILTLPPATPKADEIHVAVFKFVWLGGARASTYQLELVITDFVPQVSESALLMAAATVKGVS